MIVVSTNVTFFFCHPHFLLSLSSASFGREKREGKNEERKKDEKREKKEAEKN